MTMTLKILRGALLASSIILSHFVSIQCQELAWQPLDFDPPHICNDIGFDQFGNLYAATDGEFVVSHWDGIQWDALEKLPSGYSGITHHIEIDQEGNLFVGGFFYRHSLGEVLEECDDCAFLAKWDGSVWTFLSGLDFTFSDNSDFTIAPDGTIYAYINYETVLGYEPKIFTWNGTSWIEINLGSFSNNDAYISAIAADNNRIIISAETNDPDVFLWDGTSLTSLGAPNDVNFVDLILDNNGDLYASGGIATRTTEASINLVSKWDGTSWTPLGGGLSILNSPLKHTFANLVMDANGTLYTSYEGLNVQKRNSNEWSEAGGWFASGFVRNLTIGPNNVIYACGDFEMIEAIDGVNGIPAKYVAYLDQQGEIDWTTSPFRLEFTPNQNNVLDTQSILISVRNPSNPLIIDQLSTNDGFDIISPTTFPITLQPDESVFVEIAMTNSEVSSGELSIRHNDSKLSNPWLVPLLVLRDLEIDQVSPTEVAYGTEEEVVITGSGFEPTVKVFIENGKSGSIELVRTYYDQQSIRVTIPQGTLPGEYQLFMENDEGNVAFADHSFVIIGNIGGIVMDQSFDLEKGSLNETNAQGAEIKLYKLSVGVQEPELIGQEVVGSDGMFLFAEPGISPIHDYILEAHYARDNEEMRVFFQTDISQNHELIIPVSLKAQLLALSNRLTDLTIGSSSFGGNVTFDFPIAYEVEDVIESIKQLDSINDFYIEKLTLEDRRDEIYEAMRRAAIILSFTEDYFDLASKFIGRFWLDLYPVLKTLVAYKDIRLSVKNASDDRVTKFVAKHFPNAVNDQQFTNRIRTEVLGFGVIDKAIHLMWTGFKQTMLKSALSELQDEESIELRRILSGLFWAIDVSIFSNTKSADFSANLFAGLVAQVLCQQGYVNSWTNPVLVNEIEFLLKGRVDKSSGSEETFHSIYESIDQINIEVEDALQDIKNAKNLNSQYSSLIGFIDVSSQFSGSALLKTLSNFMRLHHITRYINDVPWRSFKEVNSLSKSYENLIIFTQYAALPPGSKDELNHYQVKSIEEALQSLEENWNGFREQMSRLADLLENDYYSKNILLTYFSVYVRYLNDLRPHLDNVSAVLFLTADPLTAQSFSYQDEYLEVISRMEEIQNKMIALQFNVISHVIEDQNDNFQEILLLELPQILERGDFIIQWLNEQATALSSVPVPELITVSQVDYPDSLINNHVDVELKLTNHGSVASSFTYQIETWNCTSEKLQGEIFDLAAQESTSVTIPLEIEDPLIYPGIRIQLHGATAIDRSVILAFSNVDHTVTSSKDHASGNQFQAEVYPNPFSSQFEIDIKSALRESVLVRIVDLAGVVQYRKELSLIPGQHQITVKSDDLLPGVYILVLEQRNKSLVRSILKVD